eukprot:946584-Amphidinium_carterae.1
MANPICPPTAIPECFQASIGLLDTDLQALFGSLSIPYHAQCSFAEAGFRTLADLADRWPSKTVAREKAPVDLQFRPGDNGHTDSTSLLTNVRLGQAIEHAQSR